MGRTVPAGSNSDDDFAAAGKQWAEHADGGTQSPHQVVVGLVSGPVGYVHGERTGVHVQVDGAAEPVAIGGSSVLTSTTRADGFVIVPGDSEGFPPGAEVDVLLYD